MIKVKDIKKIQEAHKKYKRLLANEKDFIKQLKYKRILREYEYKISQIELQLNNLSIKEDDTYRQLFIDRYIKGMTIEILIDKYIMSKSSIYRILNRAKELFESNRWSI